MIHHDPDPYLSFTTHWGLTRPEWALLGAWILLLLAAVLP